MTVKRTWMEVVVERLLLESAATGRVTLDAVGAAIGARAATPAEIDAIIDLLEKAGRIVGEDGAGAVGVERLRAVLVAAKALAAELQRPPTSEEIAARSGLTLDAVKHALELAKVMQR